MGKISVLIGGLIMLFAHTLIHISLDLFGAELTTTGIYGFFFVWFRLGVSGGGSSSSETETDSFENSWIEENGLYEFLFGNAFVGIIIAVLIIVAIIIAFSNEDSPLSGWFILAAGVSLLVFRFLELNDDDTFFYDSENGATYLEVPIGFIVGLIVGLKNIRSS